MKCSWGGIRDMVLEMRLSTWVILLPSPTLGSHRLTSAVSRHPDNAFSLVFESSGQGGPRSCQLPPGGRGPRPAPLGANPDRHADDPEGGPREGSEGSHEEAPKLGTIDAACPSRGAARTQKQRPRQAH